MGQVAQTRLQPARRSESSRPRTLLQDTVEEPVPHAPGEEAFPGASPPGDITRLLHRVRAGEHQALNELFTVSHRELKKLAQSRLYHGGRGNTLDTSALVAEAWLHVIRSSNLRSEDRRSFFAFASRVMRNVILDAARARLAECRGGGALEVTLSPQLVDQLSSGGEVILAVNDALLVLEEADPRLAQVVEMRYYGGYTVAQIAKIQGVDERTVQRDWSKARRLLQVVLRCKR